MYWTSLDNWIVLTGFLAAAACALPGCYLVLRRMSLMGDAISHAVLPGLAGGFLLMVYLQDSAALRDGWPWLAGVVERLDARNPFVMLAGAVVAGLLTALLTQWIHKFGRVESTAAMGIVFTSLFALGIILIRQAADSVDLDPDCVLYGSIELTPVDTWLVFGIDMPRAVVINGFMLMINVLFITLFYKELKISSFDPDLATTQGIHAGLMHYLLMAIVAATTVAAFESVGSILVIAMVVVPAATAHLLTDRLGVMLVLSVVMAGLCAVLGHLGAISLPPLIPGGMFTDTSTAGMMAVTAGVIFMAVLLTAPRYGVLGKLAARVRLAVQIAQQDLLAMLYRMEELSRGERTALPGGHAEAALAIGPVVRWLTVSGLRRRRLITHGDSGLTLTDHGRHEARDLVRTHRLWEAYLAQYLGLLPDHLHLSAERLEHATDAHLRAALADRTGEPRTDPQGRPIPPEARRGSGA